MNEKHLNVLMREWQGSGPDMSTYRGGHILAREYLAGQEVAEVPVSIYPLGPIRNNIAGYDDIMKQMKSVKQLLEEKRPRTIFTVGGGCDCDVMCMTYLNSQYENYAVVYCDAHGDVHTPESSSSHYFYGMPYRTAMGDGDRDMVQMLPKTLSYEQANLVGCRDLDPAEAEFLSSHPVFKRSAEEISKGPEQLIEHLKAMGCQHVYLHIDLDVLDPKEFSFVPLPVENGISGHTLLSLVGAINDNFKIVGLAVTEYAGGAGENNPILRQLVDLGTHLGKE
jgi:arginase